MLINIFEKDLVKISLIVSLFIFRSRKFWLICCLSAKIEIFRISMPINLLQSICKLCLTMINFDLKS